MRALILNKTKPEEKPQTRIPVSKFRPAVERVQRERRKSKEAEEGKRKKEAPEKPRRSSIPKLKDKLTVARNKSTVDNEQTDETERETKDEIPVKTKERKPVKRERIPVMTKHHYKITKKGDDVRKSENEDNIDKKENQTPVEVEQEDLEDEFNKLYDEIVDDNAGSLPDEILDTKVKDPEKLESKFEEIVHQYDEETEQVKLEPVDKARYSKIPLLRRRSSHDVKAPKQHERRLSLKTGIANKSLRVGDEKPNDSVIDINDDNNKTNGGKDDDGMESSENAYNADDHNQSVEINNNEDNFITAQSPDPVPIYNTIATPESELVKVGIFGISTREIPLENDVNQNMNVVTPEPEIVKVAIIDSTATEISLDENNSDETNVEESPEITENPEYTIVEDSTTNALVTDKPEINDVISIETGDIRERIKIEEKVITGNIEQKEIIKTATIKYDTVLQNEESEINVLQNDILIHTPQDELKSFSLLKNAIKVEERTKSRYICKPVDTEKVNNADVVTQEEEIPIEKGKVSKILRRLTSHEHSTNGDGDADIKKEEADIKAEVHTIPKKSVLSKIAMFERAEPEPPFSKKQSQRYSKPKRTISEEMRHSPKIVHEVLKPSGTEHTDKYTIVNIDIIKPVEVITNNEEQVTVVENLKEETIVFDNFDEAKFREIESIEIEPTVANNKDQNETVIVDDHRVHHTEAKELEAAEHGTLTYGEKTLEPNYTIPGNQMQHEHNKKYQIAETIDVIEEIFDNALTEHTPKDQIQTDDERTPFKAKSNNNRLYHNDDRVHKWKSTDKLIDKTLKDHYGPTPLNAQSNKNRLYNNENKVQKWKSTDALADFLPVKEKINRLKSCDDNKMKKAKSSAELELGEVVKGKVKKMIVRMNSFELLDDAREKEVVEVINVKERPRKRSVSEKIALFERKLTPVTMDSVEVDSGRALNINAKPVKNTVNSIPDVNSTNNVKSTTNVKFTTNVKSTTNVNSTNVNSTTDVLVTESEYAANIKELTNAKLTYGGAVNMSYVELRGGGKMPALALGTALLDLRLTKYIVAAAIDLGYRAIDTAFIYGNEREVGEGIQEKIQDGTVRREDLFIMSKLWSTFHRPDLVEAACRASLAATGLEYFDLYMIHNPMSFKEGSDPLPKIANVIQYSSSDYLDAWFAMEDLVTKGLVRSIGVSNFNAAQVARVVEKGRVKPVINQVECHPYLSQQRLSNFCDERDVRLSCYGVLGSKGTPAVLKSSQAAVIDDPLVQVMAAGLEISPAQLLIRYQISSGHNVVVKASSAAHLWDNLRALGAPLAPAQAAALSALNKNKRAFTFKGMGDTHRNYPFRAAF